MRVDWCVSSWFRIKNTHSLTPTEGWLFTKAALERMAFKRHFARVGAAERCTESIFTDHQRQVCDYALVYAEKKNDGEAPYSVSFTVSGTVPILLKSTIYYHKAPLAISRGGRSEALGRSLCVIRVGIHQW